MGTVLVHVFLSILVLVPKKPTEVICFALTCVGMMRSVCVAMKASARWEWWADREL